MAISSAPRNVSEVAIANAATIHQNLSVPVLYEHAVKRGEGKLLDGGTFAVYSGERTGRSRSSEMLPDGSPPRVYRVGGHLAVRMTFTNGIEYFGLQITTWADAPILSGPDETVKLRGQTFDLYYSGAKLRMVVLRERIDRLMNIKGKQSPESFHKRLGKIMWDKCGMARNTKGLEEAIVEIAGGAPGPVIEAVLPEHLPRPQAILLRRQRLRRVLGIVVPDAEVARILSALGLEVAATSDGWHVTPPARRFDLAIEEDLIEEIARIHGYGAIPATLPAGATRLVSPSEGRASDHDVRRQLVARDYLEAINYAFVDAGLLGKWQLSAGTVALANPLSAELGVMRPRLLPGLVASLARNTARQQPRVRLFEIGKTFAASSDISVAAPNGPIPVETPCIAAVACGDAAGEQWGEAARKVDFHDLKGDLDSLAALSGAVLDYRASAEPFLHPGRSADVWRDGVRIGFIGQLHPRLQRALDIDGDVLVFELALEPLRARAIPRARPLSKYPSVRRDLAFVVAEQVAWGAMKATAEHAAGTILRELRLFDRYAGKGVETGFKSFAMALILQDDSRTLNDRDVDAAVAAVVAALQAEHGAVMRG